jgi:hypothetical protein
VNNDGSAPSLRSPRGAGPRAVCAWALRSRCRAAGLVPAPATPPRAPGGFGRPPGHMGGSPWTAERATQQAAWPGGRWSTPMTPLSRSTATPSTARATAAPGSAESTRCSRREHDIVRTGGRGPTPPEGLVRFPTRAKRLVIDALRTATKLPSRSTARPLVRADSAFYGYPTMAAARRPAPAKVRILYPSRLPAARPQRRI